MGLTGTAAELEKGVRSLVGSRVDRDEGLYARTAARRAAVGAVVNTPPADGLPQSAMPLDKTWPASVVTAPPAAF